MDNYGNGYNNGYQDDPNGQNNTNGQNNSNGQYSSNNQYDSNGQYNSNGQNNPYGQYNPNNQYQQSYNGQQGYRGGAEFIPGGPGTGNNHPQFVTYLVLSILSCCCCNGIFGLIALIITFIGNNNFKTGQPYEGNFKTAKIILIIGLVVGVLVNIIYWALNGAAVMSSMGRHYY